MADSIETAAMIGDKNAAVLLQNKATDIWNFYQAKSIKKNLYAIAAAGGGAQAEDYKKKAQAMAPMRRSCSPRARPSNARPRTWRMTARGANAATIF
jgi:N-acetylglucosamine kinase-like BadF-type ATPase